MDSKLVGTWELESYEIISREGIAQEWGTHVRGLLVYTPEGFVSVAVNKDPVATGKPEKDLLDSMMFDTGSFEELGGDVVHHVAVSSDPERVGKELTRHVHLEGEVLTLTTPPEAGGIGKLVWNRLS